VFGGRTITATDCAVAAGIAEIGAHAVPHARFVFPRLGGGSIVSPDPLAEDRTASATG